MKKFKQYYSSLTIEERDSLANDCGVSRRSLDNVHYGTRGASPKLAAQMEKATQGAITRKDWFPDDWQYIWPELEGKDD